MKNGKAFAMTEYILMVFTFMPGSFSAKGRQYTGTGTGT
jgi:hypothetical protein